MGVPDWIEYCYIFALGSCIGSFLNVVIYRLPREKSLVFPGSACPACGKAIRFYDNIPLISWLVLRAKCRNCKAPVSPRYFVVELLTALAFLGVYIAYFHTDLRPDMPWLTRGGWLVLLSHLILVATFIAASGIDLELWIIPLSLCWVVTGAGILAAAAGGFVLSPAHLEGGVLPQASSLTGALAAGGGLGLVIACILLARGIIKRSYADVPEPDENMSVEETLAAEAHLNHRREILPELVFLAPVVLGALIGFYLCQHAGFKARWDASLENPVWSGFLGALWGYLIGGGVVWATRILGTLAFGKEAMGLGDVHLMGAAGAVIGATMVTVAFFVAPFFGLAWALVQMLSKKIRQIPYGPFLSLGVLVVMIFHYWIRLRVHELFFPY